jgi:hypothetical protein
VCHWCFSRAHHICSVLGCCDRCTARSITSIQMEWYAACAMQCASCGVRAHCMRRQRYTRRVDARVPVCAHSHIVGCGNIHAVICRVGIRQRYTAFGFGCARAVASCAPKHSDERGMPSSRCEVSVSLVLQLCTSYMQRVGLL